MTVRRVPGSDTYRLHCDAPDCTARGPVAATYRGAIAAGERAGWSVTVSVSDHPTVIDVCPAHRALAERRPA